ncbi:hypothetical protein E4T49_06200 [Aureobasidium sp. EXF-10728]|nr:hypothetical protein E4T49_06200 [Aureobasidium sp. EXF-10728]
MRTMFPTVVALVAYGSLSVCQLSTVITQLGTTATILSGIDPSDIAAIPEPEELGPPVGISDAAALDYDAAAVTASVLAVVVAATDAQTAVVAAATSTSVSDVSKRSYVGSNTNLQRRDRSYPIDTSSYDIPNGYTPAFINYQGSTQGRGYMTYKTLSSYNPGLCTSACDATTNCVFANIYYEKDPDKNNNPVDVINARDGYRQYCAPGAQDVAQLASVGQQFCSSFISYVPPTSTSVVLSTPAATTSVLTSVEYSTVVSNSIVTVTAADSRKKRAIVPTPDLIAHWPAQKISAACSLVATGTAHTTHYYQRIDQHHDFFENGNDNCIVSFNNNCIVSFNDNCIVSFNDNCSINYNVRITSCKSTI